MKLVSWLYKIARVARDVEVATSGDPKKVATRIKNKWVGRNLVSKIFKWPKL